MRVEVVMPKMGESLQEGTIIRWMKKVGEKIDRDEMILEISTDKVDTEVPSPVAGILAEIIAQEEETIEVGKVIAYVETEAGAAVSAPAPSAPVVVAPAPTPTPIVSDAPVSGGNLIDLVMPKMGESLQEGTIVKWIKQVGDKIERDEMILEISTDKVDTEVPSPVAGILAEILYKEEETIEVGKVIARISSGSVAPVASAPSAPAPVAPAPTPVVASQPVASVTTTAPVAVGSTFDIPRSYNGKFFSPLVKAIATENRISLEELMTINGTGVDARISKKDLESYISSRGNVVVSQAPVAVATAPVAAPTASSAPAPTTVATPSPAPAMVGEGIEVIPMDRMRQLISNHMVNSKHTSAHVTSVGEADVTNIVKFRDKFKAQFEKTEGFKLTFTPFFTKAVVDGIKQFPMMNVSVDGKNILRHRRLNLGFATALPDNNLIVPVIKNADTLNITGLARSVYDLSTRARNKQLNPDDIQGGTFTITNVGTFGTLFGTPIINQPQCGIFGIGAIKKRPVVKEVDGEHVIVVRDICYVSITYDHRVIDGMLAGQFLAAAIASLEAMSEKTIQL